LTGGAESMERATVSRRWFSVKAGETPGMIEQGRRPRTVFDPASLSAAERPNGAGHWRRVPEDSDPSPDVGVETIATSGVGEMAGSGLNKLLALLVALTLACGAAAGVAVILAPASLDGAGDGY
jgi:hypothetical protein